jgi:hypothetical protein
VVLALPAGASVDPDQRRPSVLPLDREVWEQAMYKALQLATLPSKPIPAGCYLVHNQLGPVAPFGHNGFRAWIQTRSDNLVECDCNFGGCENSKLHKRHCVERRAVDP